MKFKKGDLAQRIGGFETPHYIYRGEQLYLITNVRDDWYEGYVYLCLDQTWLRTEFFESDVTIFEEKRFRKFYRQALSSLFELGLNNTT